jgi:predicted nucleic acid-binding protein
MAASRRIAWDACTWIALIQREKIIDATGIVIEDRGALARAVIDAAVSGRCEIVISGLCLAEVSKNPPGMAGGDKVGPFFEHDYVLTAPVDTIVGNKARELMMAGHAKLRPADAIHLATALVTNVDEMHTFDSRLLAFDGLLAKRDGSKLKICKPDFGAVAPQLDVMKAPDPQTGEAAKKP